MVSDRVRCVTSYSAGMLNGILVPGGTGRIGTLLDLAWETLADRTAHVEDISWITPRGIQTSKREHEFDILIYATGFDGVTGAFDRIDIRGKNGVRLKDAWADSPHTYLGMLAEGFPNMMMVLGPHKKKSEARAEAAAERDRRMAERQADADAERSQLADLRAQHAAEPVSKKRRGPADNLDPDVDLS